MEQVSKKINSDRFIYNKNNFGTNLKIRNSIMFRIRATKDLKKII